jgi:hypothetical protein
MQDKVKNETRLSSNINIRVEMQRFGLRQVTCTWEIDMYPIELKWSVRPEARLHFDMFPFGQVPHEPLAQPMHACVGAHPLTNVTFSCS